jgi:ABC-type multidrug transport system ATPase subunit
MVTVLIVLMYDVAEQEAPARRCSTRRSLGGPIMSSTRSTWPSTKVILREVSFTLQTGHTKIFLGASGAGSRRSSTGARAAAPDAGRIFVNGEQIDRMSEDA